METGTKLEIGKVYYIKSSDGNTYQVECTSPTHTNDVWQFGFISRNIKDVYPTEAEAANS